ncbi:uncharacterized protein EI97DRAFT_436667 [Westerdykella ornata]|uniref:Mid2 domain-containing protein n=1 Tax=Westerdykella ornata TaxID=318751 RepID=A0A6A6J976_WESOR|nr:uncharacterized protein EI97DRAFT_436667 [Westerdykella ornata]KAF2272733.1 hypothetical protein EI97DRAFT_436667 [Westerdykella ornata]
MLRHLFFALTLVYSVESACYWRNGTQDPSPDYEPCSSDLSNPLHTVCCAKWDTCLPNGLCQSNRDQDIWRETCTKKNWDEGGCQELCSNERESQRENSIKVTPCDGTPSSLTWCCGDNNTACCADGGNALRYTIARRFGDPIPAASPNSSSSSIATSTPTSSTSSQSLSPNTTSKASSGSTTPSTSSGGLSSGAKAGIGIGAAFGALALIGLGLFMKKAMRWRKKALDAEKDKSVAILPPEEFPGFATPPSNGKWAYQGTFSQPEECVHELSATRDTVEILTSPIDRQRPESVKEPHSSQSP